MASDRLRSLCTSTTDSRTLRSRLVDEIRQVVDFDAYAWLLTDPETSVGTSPLADVPCLPELPRLVRLKYLTEVNRWTTLDEAAPASLHATTGGDLAGSLLWRELLSGYGSSTWRRRSSGTGSAAGGSSTCGERAAGGRSPRPRPGTSLVSRAR